MFIYLNVDYYMTEPDLSFTTLTQEYLYCVQNIAFETSVITLALLVKPYETIWFYNITAIGLPTLLILVYFGIYFFTYDFTIVEGLVFIPWRVLAYMVLTGMYVFVKVYIAMKIR